MSENLAFSFALDLMFNGQDMDYCERPISLSPLNMMSFFMEMRKNSKVCVIGPGGGRLVMTLLERGYRVDAYEGRDECYDHINEMFKDDRRVNLYRATRLDDPTRVEKLKYDAIFCMDDLRAFREEREWTTIVQRMVNRDGYFIYSQVSNQLPKKKNHLDKHFDLVASQNVSTETATEIKDSYLALSQWEPDPKMGDMAKQTLNMVEAGAKLRRNIRSGVEIRYVVWKKKPEPDTDI